MAAATSGLGLPMTSKQYENVCRKFQRRGLSKVLSNQWSPETYTKMLCKLLQLDYCFDNDLDRELFSRINKWSAADMKQLLPESIGRWYNRRVKDKNFLQVR